ncbi:hypothetical protein CRE_19531 [Caenorhabditis remanei]|uniref:uDENN domain-containing protein n=1 Tax=Caenorhabditis remanei TaxID=31234 RepID=E3NJ81_CAERE|nr:hypothetical protein CRE_19531 [Caenorhabditis remanei]
MRGEATNRWSIRMLYRRRRSGGVPMLIMRRSKLSIFLKNHKIHCFSHIFSHFPGNLPNRPPSHSYYKITKNLNKGLVGFDVFICYKKSQGTAKRLAYKPAVLDYFPRSDHSDVMEDFKLAQNVAMFCLPMGALIECWPTKCAPSDTSFSTFVLTDEVSEIELSPAHFKWFQNGTKFLRIRCDVFIPAPEPFVNQETNEEMQFVYGVSSGHPDRQTNRILFSDTDGQCINFHFPEASRCSAVRTKPETRSSLLASTNAVKTNPLHWSKTLLFYSYSLWFMQLDSLLIAAPNKKKIIRLAFNVLDRMEKTEIFPPDQMCYRILNELCGKYNQPEMAVEVMRSMQRAGLEQVRNREIEEVFTVKNAKTVFNLDIALVSSYKSAKIVEI